MCFEGVRLRLLRVRCSDPVLDRECCRLTEVVPILNTFESVAPTASTDRQCQALTVCNAYTEFMSKAETATSDRECSTTAACASDEYQTSAPTTSTDRQCTKHTEARTASWRDCSAYRLHRQIASARICVYATGRSPMPRAT